MDNFTPLNSRKKKKKINKFFLISNILLMVFVVGFTGYYIKSRLLETLNPKACGTGPNDPCPQTKQQINYGENTWVGPDVQPYDGGVAGGTAGKWHWTKCINCTTKKSGGGGSKGGGAAVTIPTDTPIPTSTPTPTVILITLLESPTPTDILFEITPTLSPTPSNTPIPTIAQLVCATKDCNENSRPCVSGNVCIKANNGSNYCSSSSYVDACKANPSYDSCCSAPGVPTATPTEIIIAKISPSPTAIAKLLKTGMVKSFMYLIPAIIMLVGLIL